MVRDLSNITDAKGHSFLDLRIYWSPKKSQAIRETKIDTIKRFIFLDVISPRHVVSMSTFNFSCSEQEKKYVERIKEKVLQPFPEKVIFFQPNDVPRIVANEKTAEENVDTCMHSEKKHAFRKLQIILETFLIIHWNNQS